MIVNFWMSWMCILHKKDKTTPKNAKNQQIKEY